MSRNFYIGLLVVAVGVGAVFLYRTETPLEQTAEFGGVSLRLEYAMTPEARERGLGGRTEIQKDYGMLFVFPVDDYYGFWMNDMLMPIDIFWLDERGAVVFIEESVAPSTYPHVFYPPTPARYVLETAAGFTRAHEVATGTPLVLKGGLKNLQNVSE